jgi:TonB family protein
MTRLIIISLILVLSNSLMAQEETIFTVVEEMPTFLGCEDDTISTKRCTESQLLKYIYKNFKYPSIARENGIMGLIVVTFVVNEKGKIEDAKTLKDIGGGCGDEVIRVIETMNEGDAKWIAGKQKGEKVKVRYNVPFRFKPSQAENLKKKDSTTNDKIYTVDKMPAFKGCENTKNEATKKACTEASLVRYIYEKLDRKKIKRNRAKGNVIITFVINKKGKVEDIKVLKSAGEICDKEAIRIIETMNEDDGVWIAGEQRGKPIKVQYNAPIRFTGR